MQVLILRQGTFFTPMDFDRGFQPRDKSAAVLIQLPQSLKVQVGAIGNDTPNRWVATVL